MLCSASRLSWHCMTYWEPCQQVTWPCLSNQWCIRYVLERLHRAERLRQAVLFIQPCFATSSIFHSTVSPHMRRKETVCNYRQNAVFFSHRQNVASQMSLHYNRASERCSHVYVCVCVFWCLCQRLCSEGFSEPYLLELWQNGITLAVDKSSNVTL